MSTYSYDADSKTFVAEPSCAKNAKNATSYPGYGFEALLNRIAERNNVALAIMSPPGCGKTANVEYWCEMNNRPCVKLTASTLDETDLAGVLALKKDEETCKWMAPDFVQILGENGVLFLDELNCARHTVLQTLLGVIQSRELPNSRVKLGKGVMIVACMNPADMCDNTELSPAMRSRFMWVEYDYTYSQFTQRMTGRQNRHLVKKASETYLTYKDWEKQFIFNDDFESDKKDMLVAADNLGLKFTASEEIPDKEMITNARSMSMLLYFCKSAKEIATWAPAFVDKEAADILKSIEFSPKNDVANAIFNTREAQSVNGEEDSLLNERGAVLSEISEHINNY